MDESSRLGAADAGRLAHALVGRIAAEAGIRVLSIKGAFASDYGLRAARVPADADFLVETGALERLCALLESASWHARAGRMPPTFIDLHSITLINDRWPCDLDVHRFFPGFFADPEIVFEQLWSNRRVQRTRVGPVVTPSVGGMAVILALHAQRTPYAFRSQRDYDSVRHAIMTAFSPADIRDFTQTIRVGRSQWVLRDLLHEIGITDVDDDATDEEKALWRSNQQSPEDKSASLWIRQVVDARLSDKPRAILHALWVPRSAIPRNDPDRQPSLSEALRYQRARWSRGVRSLSSYLRRSRA